jgi:hypothetical protein
MTLENGSATDEVTRSAAHYVTRDEVDAAFDRAVSEVELIGGEDDTISAIAGLGAGEPPGSGPFTFEKANAAWNAVAERAKDDYNPEDVESSRTIRSDSCGDLIVNLATGFLRNPSGDVDDVIVEQWADLEPGSFEGFEVWNRHDNDLGDYCPWSRQWAIPENREALMSGLAPDDLCPQGCRASTLEDPPKGSKPYKAAIVATVKEWLL